MSLTQSSPLIHIAHADFGYKEEENPALRDVNVSFYPGDQIALIGPNGAGKSTFFKTIVGLIKPLRGTVEIHGGVAHRDCISYIPQKEEIDWNYPINVYSVVMMGRFGKIRLFSKAQKSDREAVEKAMRRMDIWELRDRKISDCSGGQQQRVFLARSLAQEPHILLMDEPFTGVDALTRDIILENLRILKSDGMTAIVSTHDLELVSSRFEKAMLLNTRLIAFGKTEDVMTKENLESAFGRRIFYTD